MCTALALGGATCILMPTSSMNLHVQEKQSNKYELKIEMAIATDKIGGAFRHRLAIATDRKRYSLGYIHSESL